MYIVIPLKRDKKNKYLLHIKYCSVRILSATPAENVAPQSERPPQNIIYIALLSVQGLTHRLCPAGMSLLRIPPYLF